MDAIGQLFFSISVAMGIMITYGSYVKDDVNLMSSINQIEFFDTLVATPCRTDDYSGNLHFLRYRRYVSRTGTDVCIPAKGICCYG